jgi:hypothetical protein
MARTMQAKRNDGTPWLLVSSRPSRAHARRGIAGIRLDSRRDWRALEHVALGLDVVIHDRSDLAFVLVEIERGVEFRLAGDGPNCTGG